MADTFSFEGGPELKRELKKMQDRFLQEMHGVLKEEANTIMQLGKAQAPEQSGELAAGTSVVVSKRQDRVEAAASFTRERAAAVHEGVHWGRKVQGTEGYHWYGDAAADWEPKAQQRIVTRLQALTNEKGGKGSSSGPKRKSKSRPSAAGKAFKRTIKRAKKTAVRTAKKAVKAGRKLARRARKATRKALR